MPQPQSEDNPLKPGDYYEDCSYEPCVAFIVDYENDFIEGVSLVQGHRKCCSLRLCGVLKLTLEEAILSKLHGPLPREGVDGEIIDPKTEYPWWNKDRAWWLNEDGTKIWGEWNPFETQTE